MNNQNIIQFLDELKLKKEKKNEKTNKQQNGNWKEREEVKLVPD